VERDKMKLTILYSSTITTECYRTILYNEAVSTACIISLQMVRVFVKDEMENF
jgi:hypothetical protein